jgi:hypothetical protein
MGSNRIYAITRILRALSYACSATDNDRNEQPMATANGDVETKAYFKKYSIAINLSLTLAAQQATPVAIYPEGYCCSRATLFNDILTWDKNMRHRFVTFPVVSSGDDGVFNAGSNASVNDSGAGRLEPMFFRTFRWLFGGVSFRTEGMRLLLPTPALYRRKPREVVKDVRIKN